MIIDAIYHFLEKIGYPHPLHAPLTHMPIGLVTGALIMGLIGRLWRRPSLWLAARYCIILAVLFLFPTVLFGYMDWQYFYAGAWLSYIKIKMILAAILLILLSLGIFLTRKPESNFRLPLAIYALCFCTVVVLGYYGGQLVFMSWTPAAPQEFRLGGRIFKGNCSGCHANGGNLIAPNLPLRSAPELADFDSFLAFIRHPTMPNGSVGEMPPFPAAKISDPHAQELYQYIVNVIKAPKRY
jgi:uncharacterized membrane protein